MKRINRACLRLQTTRKGRKERSSWADFANDIREEYFAFALFQTDEHERPTRFFSLIPGPPSKQPRVRKKKAGRS